MQGEPRATHDFDVITTIPMTSVERPVDALRVSDLHYDESAILSAIREKTMFNLIDSRGGSKVDFWIESGGYDHCETPMGEDIGRE